MRLYLDVETYRKRNKDTFVREKVIAIGLLVDRTRYSPESLEAHNNGSVEFQHFTTWTNEGRLLEEESVIRSFYENFVKLVNSSEPNNKFVVVVGYHLLRFDVPLLVQKGAEYNVMQLPELNRLWHNTPLIDYAQVLLPFNGMRFKGFSLDNVSRRLGNLCPHRETGRGSTVVKLYNSKEYDKILKHLKEDLETVRCIDLRHNEVIRRLGKRLFGGGAG